MSAEPGPESGPEPGPGTGPEPGTLRPGGRTARVRTAVLRAAGDVLAEQGVDRLDLSDVARRAGVGKTTVYRRWGSVTALVADLLVDMAEQSLPREETGSLLGDLRANALLVQRTLADPGRAPCSAPSSPPRPATTVRPTPCATSTRYGSPSGRPVSNRAWRAGSCPPTPIPSRSYGPCRHPSTTSC